MSFDDDVSFYVNRARAESAEEIAKLRKALKQIVKAGEQKDEQGEYVTWRTSMKKCVALASEALA